LAAVLGCFISFRSEASTNLPPTNGQSGTDQKLAFDEDVGMDASWAAEKKLFALFKAEGFISIGGSFTNHIEYHVFRAGQVYTNGTHINFRWGPTDKGTVDYAIFPGKYPHPSTYRLSAARGSPACSALMSVAGKISADRLSALKDALEEFNSTKTPVVKAVGDFTKRGDFRVKVNQDTVELENLWRGKGL
jgi:hypothetical protein